MTAIVFDFDGLMVDTESAIFDLWQDIYQHHGVTLQLDKWIQCVGTQDKFDPYLHLEELKGTPIDKDEIRAHFNSLKITHTAVLPLLPGVTEKILEARNLKCGVAVASSSARTWVHDHLERREIFATFDHICTKDDVAKVKPDPEIYLLAANRLGRSPAECLAFEDSANGMTAAKDAGFKCVVVPNKVTRGSDFSRADLILTSLGQNSLSEIFSKLKMKF